MHRRSEIVIHILVVHLLVVFRHRCVLLLRLGILPYKVSTETNCHKTGCIEQRAKPEEKFLLLLFGQLRHEVGGKVVEIALWGLEWILSVHNSFLFYMFDV